jgi:hypothetical protein
MKSICRINAIAGITAIAFACAAPAVASSYYSASSPLIAYQDGVPQALMYGRFSLENLTYLRNRTNLRDPRPGGDAVFERTEYYYDYDDGDGFRPSGRDQSPKTKKNAWSAQYDHDQIPDEAERGKERTQVCEDHGFWPDPCSPWPFQIFNL